MKKALSLFTAIWLCSISAFACGADISLYYESVDLFQFSPYDRMDIEKYRSDNLSESVDFWYDYFGGKASKSDIKELISGKTDELKKDDKVWAKNSFYKLLMLPANAAAKEYINITFHIVGASERWDYEADNTANSSLAKLNAIKGMNAKLAERSLLLKMQCLYNAADYNAVEKLWNESKDKLSNQRMIDRMKGYYAGALYNTKQYESALKIYDAIGDYNSCRWVLSKMAGFKELERQVKKDVNSVITLHLLDRYANNINMAHRRYHENLEMSRKYDFTPNEELAEVWNATKKEMKQLDMLADNVIKEGKTNDAAMWYAIRIQIRIIEGDFEEAMVLSHDATNAVSKTEYSKDVLRVLRVTIQMRHEDPWLPELQQYLAGEFAYFYEKAQREYDGWGEYTDKEFIDNPKNYHFAILYAYMYNEIEQYLDTKNLSTSQYLLRGALDIQNLSKKQGKYATSDKAIFGTDKAYYLYQMNSEDAVAIYNTINENKLNPFDKYLYEHAGKENIEFLRDAAGVALLREGKLQNAFEMFEGLSPKYLKSMNVMAYIQSYDIDVDGLFGKSKKLDAKNVRNARKEVCELLINLENQYKTSSGEQKARIAYQIANVNYQISELGNLWGVGSYRCSSSTEEDDFTKISENYIKEALKYAQSGNLKAKCHYANAVLNYADKNKFLANYVYLKEHAEDTQDLCKSCDWLNDYVNGGFSDENILGRNRKFFW